MNNKEFVEKIRESYEQKNYNLTLEYLEQYLKIKTFGFYDELLDIYIKCQINLGYFESAGKNLNLMKKMFRNFYSKYDLITKYIICGNIDKAKILISSNKLVPLDYYYIAKTYFLWGYHNEAKKLFNHFLFFSNEPYRNESAKNYLRKIELYENNKNVFVETDYLNFKRKGHRLETGHIIYTEKLLDIYKENITSTDPKKEKRPYMIWKIVDNKIYAFPVSSKIYKNSFNILRTKNYPNYTYDRKVKENLVCIEEKDVIRIMDKVSKKDYDTIIKNIYIKLCHVQNKPKPSAQFFISEMVKDLKINRNDVIVVMDYNVKKTYFVIDIDQKKHKYKTIEVKINDDKSINVISPKLQTISMDAHILDNVKLEKKQINKLLKQVPDNYRGLKMTGSVIEYNSQKLEIMLEEENCYVCIDKTFNSHPSFIQIEFIRKDIPLFPIERVPFNIYEKQLEYLRDYIVRNHNEIKDRKKLFLKHI